MKRSRRAMPERPSLRTPTVLILSDDSDFARVLMACWQAERHPPAMTAVSSSVWGSQPAAHDLAVLGPVKAGKLESIVASLDSGTAIVLCTPADAPEVAQLKERCPRVVHIPWREDWARTIVLVAGESLRRIEAMRLAQRAEQTAAQQEQYATLGRYMLEMKHSVNNALTSMLGHSELLLLEPGQLSAAAREQIKTIHSMALRLSEIMQRFSSLASEMRELEKASQAETEEVSTGSPRRD